MSLDSRSRPRCSFVLALLVTTAATALLGACTSKHTLFPGSSATASLAAEDPNAAGAVAQWAQAYAKKPQDPQMAIGYARALKAAGSKDRALELLKLTYQSSPTNGEVAAELLALDMGRIDIAKVTLQTAEAQGVRD
jgi:Flp pilus assembly protein TadD